MIDIKENGCVREIVIQPHDARLGYSWDIALRSSAFTELLHSFLAAQKSPAAIQSELSVGNSFLASWHITCFKNSACD